jgi:molecular chaperone GrpE
MNDRSNGAAGAEDNGNPDQASNAKTGGTRAEERIASLDTSAASMADLMDDLSAKLEAATEKAEAAEAGWQRARADFTNFKRRTEEERAESGMRASDSLLLKVVALADDFDLAIDHVPAELVDSPWVEGIGAIDRKLRQLLENAGVKPMQSEGQPFDPHEHQAISYEDTTEIADGTVLKELQRGYYVGERVLRPAFVAVASNDGSMNTDNANINTDKE